MQNYAYGCLPPKVDVRDYTVSAAAVQPDALPHAFSLDDLPKVKSQGTVGSCVAHATSSILEYFDKSQHKLSTNFIYGIRRKEFNQTGYGMYLSDACKIVKKYGDMLEEDCKGNTEAPGCHPIAEAALEDADKAARALVFRIDTYFSCKNNNEIKHAIYNYKTPILASIRWYDGAKVKNGILTADTSADYGYHAIMIYGWDERGFLCQNSWGSWWGDKGRFILPFDYAIREAKGFVDAVNMEDIDVPKSDKILNFLYKALNWIINLFNQLKDKF